PTNASECAAVWEWEWSRIGARPFQAAGRAGVAARMCLPQLIDANPVTAITSFVPERWRVRRAIQSAGPGALHVLRLHKSISHPSAHRLVLVAMSDTLVVNEIYLSLQGES